jgi:hypothetical protein
MRGEILKLSELSQLRQWPGTLVGFTDIDGNMAEDRRTISGHAFQIDGAAIS